MNSIRLQCFVVFLLLCLIGFGPLSITALLGMYVVWRRPHWFLRVVDGLYRGAHRNPAEIDRSGKRNLGASTTATRVRCFLALMFLLVLDIAPVPVVGGIGLYVIIRRPRWFVDLVDRIYGRKAIRISIDDARHTPPNRP